MEEVDRTDARESARRSLQAAIEHLAIGDYRTAAALFRCGARFVERIGEEAFTTTGVVVRLPRLHHAMVGMEPIACWDRCMP